MKQNWTYKKLGEVATFVNGYPFKPDDWEETGMPIIRIQNLNNPNAIYNYYSGSIDARYIVRNGDVLISWSGTLGVYEWNKNESALLNQHIFKVVFDKIPINKFFFKYAVSSRISEMKSKVHGITMQHITKGEFDKTIIPVPPLSTQHRIVSELDLLQSLIDKQKAQLKELDTLAQSIFYDMFGDPVENEKGWEVKKLEEIVSDECPISYGIVQPGDGVENGIPVVRPVDMTHTFVYRQGLKQTTKEISNSYKRTILKGNEILLCVRGTTGLVSLATDELKGCNVTRGVTPIECNAKNDRWFVYFQFLTNAIQQHIAEYTKGIALKQINMKDVREIPFIIPPLSLQQSFASKIESIEKQKSAISKSIAETEKLFEYTMDKYFG